MAKSTHTVFVYGSLLSGLGNHHYLETSTKVGDATIAVDEKLAMFDFTGGAYPHVCAAKDCQTGATKIKGEIYEVNDETLESLDWLEGCPTHYGRKRVSASLDSGLKLQAYVYIASKETVRHSEGPKISDGDWRRHEAAVDNPWAVLDT